MFPGLAGAQRAVETLYVEDVFSAFTDIGTGASLAQANGNDLATKGGMVWIKGRSGATDHAIYDTARGVQKDLVSNSTAAETTQAQGITAFNSNGFTRGTLAKLNTSTATYISWVFRKAAKFFDVQTKSHTNGVASTVDLSILGTVGQVIVKRTDSTGDWYVWHRSSTAGNNLRLNTTAAQSTTDAYLSVSGTILTIASGMPTGSYVVYAWAHDTASDGIIQCGSFVGSTNVTLGWEPQYVLVKRLDSTGNWFILDTARGFDLSANDNYLLADSTSAEAATALGTPISTGFNIAFGAGTYIYMAIRKGLMRPPTDATKVFAINARTGTSATATVTAGSITQGVDFVITKQRSSTATHNWQDRLRGSGSQLTSVTTAAQTTDSDRIISFNMADVRISTDATLNTNTLTYINYLLKQAHGFLDIVAYLGTSSTHTETHNLGVTPELMIIKATNFSSNWAVYYGDNTDALLLNSTAATVDDATYWNDTNPTSSVFTVGTHADVNTNVNYIAYLFATLAGVSKVDTYTGNATTNQINCGFAAGARFVLIKRIDSTGDWYFFDTTRGLVSGNDPYLLMNSTAAEVTSTDYIDPYSAGFELSSTAPAAINASGGTFLFLAIA
jgi:hypothetical protein